MSEPILWPQTFIAGFGQCFLAELSLAFFAFYLLITTIFLLMCIVLFRGFRKSNGKAQHVWWGVLLFVQTLLFLTFLEQVLTVGAHIFEGSCTSPGILAVFIAGIGLVFVLLIVLLNKRLLAPKRPLNITHMRVVVLVTAIVSIFLYSPFDNGKSWHKYPVWYRCTVLPVQYQFDKTKGVTEEPILDSDGKPSGVRYHYDNDYPIYRDARDGKFANYCLVLSVN